MHYHPRHPGEDPELHGNYGPEAAYAVAAEAGLPTTKWDEEPVA